MITPPRALVVQNDADSGPGRIADWLHEAGIALDIYHGYADPNLPTYLEQDAMIVLGGGFLPDADDRAAWLAPTRELTRQAINNGTPFLGLCLGGQLLAHVAGGAVTADVGAPENGSTAITLRDNASDDPLFHDLPREVTAIEHHVDAITTLPSSAVWLAESQRCPYQALRVGERAWGTQFHPEISPERVRAWEPDRLREQGFDPDEVYAQAAADDPASKQIWQTVVKRFASLVHTDRRAELALPAFEVILGEPDFLTHFMLKTTPEQRLQQPPHDRGKSKLQVPNHARATLNGTAFEAGLKLRHGMRDAVCRQRHQTDVNAAPWCQLGVLNDLGLAQPREFRSTRELHNVPVAALPEHGADFLIDQGVTLDIHHESEKLLRSYPNRLLDPRSDHKDSVLPPGRLGF